MAGSVAEQRYQQFKDQGYQSFFYVAETNSGQTPDAAYCKAIRAQYGLTMPVLYGPLSILSSMGISGAPNDWNVLIDSGGKLLYRKKGGGQSTITSQIEAEL